MDQPGATDGTYLVFQAASGNLIVVLEPSTIVFAGLGVAMSGWLMWKKRRPTPTPRNGRKG